MNWYDVDKATLDNLESVYHDAKISKNDDNIKPDWISHHAENTEFHILRKKDELLIVIGESWTYGESLPKIATGIQQYNLESQLRYAFGPKLAIALDFDLYQYAVPGNCNYYMIRSVERIVEHVTKNFNYKKIHLCFQLTDPGRELAVSNKLTDEFAEMYNFQNKTFDEWLVEYDELFLNKLEEIHKKNNIEILVWKNFCSFNNKKQYTTLKLIQQTWIQFSAELLGIQLDAQKFQSVGWFDDFSSQFRGRLILDYIKINSELDKIERSNNFIKTNIFHNNHPTRLGHQVWADKLYNEYTK